MGDPLGLIDPEHSKYRELLGRVEGLTSAAHRGDGASNSPGRPIGERPFTGFDRERATYQSIKPNLLAWAAGQFVAVVGEEFEGPVPSFAEAERAGYRRFGLGPLFIKQILVVETVAEISRVFDSCPW